MLQKKEFPEEGELLLCTVTKIFGHSVFVNIDTYDRSGMIHISEISPGRIRNLRDYVVEGKKIICVVLRVHKDKGHIDLSLRRVSEGQRRKKVENLKQEQKSEKIIEQIAKELHKDEKQFKETIINSISKEYKNVNSCFVDIVNNKVELKDLGIEKDAAEKLTEMVKERMKPPKISIGGELVIQIFSDEGIEIIKDVLKKTEDADKDKIKIRYLGGGNYGIDVTGKDYKEAEKILKKATDFVIETIEKKDGKANFKRIDKKAEK